MFFFLTSFLEVTFPGYPLDLRVFMLLIVIFVLDYCFLGKCFSCVDFVFGTSFLFSLFECSC